jgi:K(+)-stimulated pyrophosphate-energized sodium pump
MINIWLIWLVAPIGAALALVFAYYFAITVLAHEPGNERMQKIASYIRRGAFAYLKQQYKVVAFVFVILVILLSILAFGLKVQSRWVPFAFLTGGFFSGLCGFLGMNIATLSSSRTSWGSMQSLNKGLQIALRGGAVMGLVVVGFGLLDITLWFIFLTKVIKMDLFETTVTMLAFGMGASTQALFARVGGGIYTKAADVGSDLVGKIEQGIPEDDPRNPATIADNVGDNVGDVAGMGADLYESYCGSILSTAALGFSCAVSYFHSKSSWQTNFSESLALPFVILPMVIAGVGNLLSILGVLAVKTKKEEASLKVLMAALFRGINIASIGIGILSLLVIVLLFSNHPLLSGVKIVGIPKEGFMWWISICLGILSGWIIGKSTEYYTSNDFKPTQSLAEKAQASAATVLIEGTALGMIATWVPILSVTLIALITFIINGGSYDVVRGLYGISLAAVGMLSTLGIMLATDAYGPIADNAGGISQMSELPPYVRERTDALDALGNTTAATGKGLAIGSAALTALALVAAYIEEIRVGVERYVKSISSATALQTKIVKVEDKEIEVKEVDKNIYVENTADKKAKIYLGVEQQGDKIYAKDLRKFTFFDFMNFFNVNLMNPKVISGMFIGVMVLFLFCGMTLKAVGRAATEMVNEVRRQFREFPGILEGKQEPDYARCVAISTRGAQKEMLAPALLAIIVPVVVGIFLGIGGVIGLLTSTLASGFAVAIMMASAGGAWDNAKKWIEKGNFGGKGSYAHKQAVVGDTVGDPYKDTTGPSINILVKLMSMVSIVVVGFILKSNSFITKILNF